MSPGIKHDLLAHVANGALGLPAPGCPKCEHDRRQDRHTHTEEDAGKHSRLFHAYDPRDDYPSPRDVIDDEIPFRRGENDD